MSSVLPIHPFIAAGPILLISIASTILRIDMLLMSECRISHSIQLSSVGLLTYTPTNYCYWSKRVVAKTR